MADRLELVTGLRRLGAVGRRWSSDLPRWWPTPLWAWAWFSAGMRVAERDGYPSRLRGGWRSLRAAWLWATEPRRG